MARTKRNPGFKTKDERMNFYENEFKTQRLGSGGSGGYWYQWSHGTGGGGSIFPGPDGKTTTRIIRKTKPTSKACAKARMTMRITGTTPRRGTSRKTKTRKPTRLATRRATAIEVIILRGRPAKRFPALGFASRTANEGRRHSCLSRRPSFAECGCATVVERTRIKNHPRRPDAHCIRRIIPANTRHSCADGVTEVSDASVPALRPSPIHY